MFSVKCLWRLFEGHQDKQLGEEVPLSTHWYLSFGIAATEQSYQVNNVFGTKMIISGRNKFRILLEMSGVWGHVWTFISPRVLFYYTLLLLINS